VLTVTAPRSPVVKTCAPAARQRETTGGCGWPWGESRPTLMTASAGRAAVTKAGVEEVRELL
jgi:hypothetical protein